MFNIKELFNNLGIYNLRARISVGIIFLAPWILELYLLIPELNSVSSTLIVGIITYGLCNIIIVYSRVLGVKAMKKCFPVLLPAQEALLPSDHYIDSVTKQRYYKFLSEHMVEFKISSDDSEMDPYVRSAVTWLISRTRDSSKFPLIAEENMNFGFTYNLLGLKPYGIVLSSIGILFNFMLLYPHLSDFTSCSKIIAGLMINALFLLLWIFVITRQLVISSGKKYARALLSACDSSMWDY
ncbi:hypothetical protein [uncultured Clostridium sp.]|uniref:hypothetical protein n=1 Tax=uncultured Clostridium sp. TaxID=59620 RepID=UPI0025EFB73A|nr:hypothetical protein [uncultured Clostridium sp.]